MSVDDRFLRDPRVQRMAEAIGWSKYEARGRLLDVFAIVYDRANADRALLVSDVDIDTAACFPGLASRMIEFDLAVKTPRGVLVRGSKEHTKYLSTRETSGRAGGVKSGETRRKKRAEKTKVTFDKNEGRSNPSSLPSDLPSSLPQASALARVPDTEQVARARGELAIEVWGRLASTRLALAAELGLTDIAPLTVIGGSEPRGFRDLRARIREEGDHAAVVCERVLVALATHARDTRSVEWLSDKATTEGGWRFAKNWTARRNPSVARPGHGGRADIENNTFTDGER